MKLQVGDQYTYENRRTGIRYKGQVLEIKPDGRVVGTPTSYWPEFDLLVDVKRPSNK